MISKIQIFFSPSSTINLWNGFSTLQKIVSAIALTILASAASVLIIRKLQDRQIKKISPDKDIDLIANKTLQSEKKDEKKEVVNPPEKPQIEPTSNSQSEIEKTKPSSTQEIQPELKKAEEKTPEKQDEKQETDADKEKLKAVNEEIAEKKEELIPVQFPEPKKAARDPNEIVTIRDRNRIYKGTVIEDHGQLVPHGQGRFEYGRADYYYEGSFERAIFEGEGTYVCYDPVFDAKLPTFYYQGTFKDGNFVVGQTDSLLIKAQFISSKRPPSLIHSLKERYKGRIENQLFNGEGELTNPKGEYCKGQFKDGVFVSGKCRIQKKVHILYEGDYPNGEGEEIYDKIDPQVAVKRGYSNGTKYVGHFENGQYNGKGILTHPNGTYYDGIFKDGEFVSGKCKVNLDDGYVYEGEYPTGKGIKQSDRYKFEGRFDKYILQEGTKIVWDGTYEGTFYNEELTKGSFTNRDGYKSEGEFQTVTINGKKGLKLTEGTGKIEDYEYKDDFVGNITGTYKGGVHWGRPHGEGRIDSRWSSGKIYVEGTFVRGELTGQGSREKDGYFQQGQFNRGRPRGEIIYRQPQGNINVTDPTEAVNIYDDQGRCDTKSWKLFRKDYTYECEGGSFGGQIYPIGKTKGKRVYTDGKREEGLFQQLEFIKGKIISAKGEETEFEHPRFKDLNY